MGSTTSLQQQKVCCGLCSKTFKYQQALKIFIKSLNQYQQSLHKNIDQFKQKDQKLVRQNLNDVKQQAYKQLQNQQQLRARQTLTNFFHQQKQPKLLTREIDFLDNKQKMLQQLRTQITRSTKPYQKKQQRDQIIGYEKRLQKIKQMQFNQNQDQKSGDSGDLDSYVDRIMNELKNRIRQSTKVPQKVPQKIPQKIPIVEEIKPVPKVQVVKEKSREENRKEFLRKLLKSNIKGEQRLRYVTAEEGVFFKNNLGIELNANSKIKGEDKVWYSKGGQGSVSNFNLKSEERIVSLSQLPNPSLLEINDKDRGYYLNCNGVDSFEMDKFLKCDWPMVQVLDFQQCKLTTSDWKSLSNAQSICLANLKVLYLGLNQIEQVTINQINSLKGVRYLSFGWYSRFFSISEQSNNLSLESKNNIEKFLSSNPHIKIQYPLP